MKLEEKNVMTHYKLQKKKQKKKHFNNPIYVQHIWHNDFLSKYSFIY